MARRLALIVWLVASLTACARKEAPPPPESYLSHRGTVMPIRSAMEGVSFRPFVPSRQIVEAALIPAYNGGEDTRANRGIAFEYVSNHESYAISEWPGSGQSGPVALKPERGCAISAYHLGDRRQQEGVLWSARGLVFTLVPTGNAGPRATVAEARRLVRLGACR